MNRNERGEVVPFEAPTRRQNNFATYDADVVEWAQQLWTWVCGRNGAEVSAALAKGNEKLGIPPTEVPQRTIQDWARRYKWQEQASKALHDLAPGIFETVDQTLIGASLHAARYVHQVLEGSVPVSKDVLRAAEIALDRTGHLPWTRPADNAKLPGPQKDVSGSIAELSNEELMRRAYGIAPQDEGENE